MGLSKTDFNEASRIAKILSNRLELKKDLPAMVFRGAGLEYTFLKGRC